MKHSGASVVFGCLDVARAADLLGEHVDVFFVRDNADRAIGPIGQIVLPNAAEDKAGRLPSRRRRQRQSQTPQDVSFLGY